MLLKVRLILLSVFILFNDTKVKNVSIFHKYFCTFFQNVFQLAQNKQFTKIKILKIFCIFFA